jgi:hypothetical protein
VPIKDLESSIEGLLATLAFENLTTLRSWFLKFARATQQLDAEDRDGFQVSQRPFTLPPDSATLDPTTKRALTICNLFVNHWLPIDGIASLLEEDRRAVILTLIHRNIIYDRRHRRGTPRGNERRRNLH